MEAIRAIQTVENGEVSLQLPEQFWGQEVEINVLGSPRTPSGLAAPRQSLCGSLQRYAKPDLMAEEENAWSAAVSDLQRAGGGN